MTKLELLHNETDAVLATVPGDTLWEVDLSGRHLAQAAFYAIRIVDPLNTGSDVGDIGIRKVGLSGVALRNANLRGAVFSGESIVGADFSGADLTGSYFVGTSLANCHFSGAKLAEARFGATSLIGCEDFHLAQGLTALIHHSPSTLDPVTLRSCITKLPAKFLRGIGHSAEEVVALRIIYAKKTEYESCFISYARNDQEFSDALRNSLTKANIACWQDKHSMQGGAPWRKQIYEAIEKHDKLVLVCSRASLVREAVVEEIIEAIEHERHKKLQKLYPLRVDDYIFSEELASLAKEKTAAGEWKLNWVQYVKAYHIPDFTGWKTQSHYRREMAKLVDSLRTSTRPRKPAQ